MLKCPLLVIVLFIHSVLYGQNSESFNESLSDSNSNNYGLFDTTTTKPEVKLKPVRLAAAGTMTASMLLIPYIYLQTTWWKDNTKAFHFDDIKKGGDFRYARNLDKGGHFMGGVWVSDIGKSWLMWGGLKERPSAWLGAFMGTFYQLSIELKDAYAPYYGFSVYDLGYGTLGSLTIVAKTYFPKAEYVDFKFSYYYRSNKYFELAAQQSPNAKKPIVYHWVEDYVNQNYWVTFNLAKAIHPHKHWTNGIGLALGVGLDDSQYLDESLTKMGGKNEYYISLDYDLVEIARYWNSKTGKKVAYWLNYIKLPTPTLQFYPKRKFYPLYM